MDTDPPQPEPSRGRRFRPRRDDGRRAQRTPRDGQPPSRRDTRYSRWLLASTGLVLLAVAIIMMACGAQPSRAQTVHPAGSSAQASAQPRPSPRYSDIAFVR